MPTKKKAAPQADIEFSYRPIDDLIPYVSNARTHSETQVAEIAGSIRQFGFLVPILIDDNGTVIAGHGRLQAARKLGLEQVPVVVASNLSDNQRRAYTLADNRIALNAGWDLELLRVEVRDLAEDDVDVLSLGFEVDELDKLLGDDDQFPLETDEGDSHSGANELWLRFGKHTILMSEFELANLEGALTDYIDQFGTDTGFASTLVKR